MKNYSGLKIALPYHTLCLMRQSDRALLIKYFETNDCIIVNDPAAADLIIFMTCAFHHEKEKRCLDIIKRLKDLRGELIVYGCLTVISPDELGEIFDGKIVATGDFNKFDEIFVNFKFSIKRFKHPYIIPPLDYSTESGMQSLKSIAYKNPFSELLSSFKKKEIYEPAYLRFSSGCSNRCTYCTKYDATGPLKSKPLITCLEEYKKLIDSGHRNFVFIGEDTCSWGQDIGSSFSELSENLSPIDRNFSVKWTIRNAHPRWIIKYKSEFIKIIKTGKLIDLRAPIQSASDRVIRAMSRNYSRRGLDDTFREIRKTGPQLFLLTHLLLGFPSEKEEDLLDTLSFIKEIGFNRVVFFPYSDRETAISYKFNDKISTSIVKYRLKMAKKILSEANISHTMHTDYTSLEETADPEIPA